MTTLPKFLRREIEAAGDRPRVLIEFQKHGTVYWNATGERLFAVALHILTERVRCGIIPTAELVEQWMRQDEGPELNEAQIAALPDGHIKAAAIRQYTAAKQRQLEYQDAGREAREAARAVATNDGVLALIILNERSDNEHERIELHVLIDPEN